MPLVTPFTLDIQNIPFVLLYNMTGGIHSPGVGISAAAVPQDENLSTKQSINQPTNQPTNQLSISSHEKNFNRISQYLQLGMKCMLSMTSLEYAMPAKYS